MSWMKALPFLGQTRTLFERHHQTFRTVKREHYTSHTYQSREFWGHRTDPKISTFVSNRTPPRVRNESPYYPSACASIVPQRRSQHHSAVVGAEPGIDFATVELKLDRSKLQSGADSEIYIVDYSDKDVVQQQVTSATLKSFLKENDKPAWAACRWIYVNGLNHDVVKTIGNKKGLHRLAIEDVLDKTTLAKVDWYETHCFMEMPLQKLVEIPRPEQKGSFNESPRQQDWRRISRRFGISVEQVSLFLTADNTVITIFEHSGQDVLKPILNRLNSAQTMIRSTNDPWMLVQANIDCIVDLSLPVGKAVGNIFADLEHAVLSAPAIAQSKEIYVLRSGLTLLMDNTNAIGGLVRTLCDHKDVPMAPIQHSIHVSQATQVYLQDVQDHITTLSNSTHMSIRSAENLTSLIFNTIAASQNQSVNQLTLVSCLFLPLTFLTGYFGMNFDPMPVVNNHSDAFFWVIATPIMLTTAMLLAMKTIKIRSFIPMQLARKKESSR